MWIGQLDRAYMHKIGPFIWMGVTGNGIHLVDPALNMRRCGTGGNQIACGKRFMLRAVGL